MKEASMNTTTSPGIALTERAAQHVRGWLARHGGGAGLRVAVKPTGCSGFQYIVEAAQKVEADDSTFDSNGVRVIVDAQSLPYLSGTELDYVREGLKEGFRFRNPHVRETCGCGESFSVDPPSIGG
jgi:iron-sulfur cluster assembly protein